MLKIILVIALVLIVFVGNIICNSNERLAGLPIFFVWNVCSVFIIALGMWVIFKLDDKNNGTP